MVREYIGDVPEELIGKLFAKLVLYRFGGIGVDYDEWTREDYYDATISFASCIRWKKCLWIMMDNTRIVGVYCENRNECHDVDIQCAKVWKTIVEEFGATNA